MKKIVNSVIELIGNTPILKLNNLTKDNVAEIYVKLEFFNPGSSVKDRIALAMIEEAEREGKIQPGDTLIEPTSGNTGIGLALVGAAKGYKIKIVMPDTMSEERKKIISAYGAELILTPGSEGMKGSIAKAKELSEKHGYFMPLQFENEINPIAHEMTTGKEILDAFDGEPIDVFVAGVGTGGTITGVAHALKHKNEKTQIIAVEPEESSVLQGKEVGPHQIQGIGAGFIPPVLDTNCYDKVISIRSEDAMEMARTVAKAEGILVGISGGAAIAAGVAIAKELPSSKKVLIVVPDSGERYLSTTLYKEKNKEN